MQRNSPLVSLSRNDISFVACAGRGGCSALIVACLSRVHERVARQLESFRWSSSGLTGFSSFPCQKRSALERRRMPGILSTVGPFLLQTLDSSGFLFLKQVQSRIQTRATPRSVRRPEPRRPKVRTRGVSLKRSCSKTEPLRRSTASRWSVAPARLGP